MIGRILALTALVAMVFLTSAAQATEDWRVDHRRPGYLEGKNDSSVDWWRADFRRPADHDGNADSDVEWWRADFRRPADLEGDVASTVEWWRVDSRRPARWPSADVDHANLDSDGDGVLDAHDDCPDTPRGTQVDHRGCPLSAKEIILLDTGSLSLDNVNFETNEAVLLPESYETLDEVGEILEKWDDLNIEIAGHTDNQGESDYNLDLSQRRAEAVLEYLTGKFKIDPGQYVAKGYGESKPVASNGTAEGRADNRRVEFTVLNREVLEREQ